ncbi:MAG: histidine kinase [Rhodanobacter lindaniclasticus]
MFRSLFFYLRLIVAWYLLVLVATLSVSWIWSGLGSLVQLLGLVVIVFVVIRAHSHLVRVRMIAGKLTNAALASRQRRQIEVPFEAEEAFELLDAAIRELPGVEQVDSTRNHLQIRATAVYADPYDLTQLGRWNPMRWIVSQRNRILATVNRGDGSSSFSLVCEPCSAPWSDWLQVDDGVNLENLEAIARAVTLGVASRRRGEQAAAAQTATEKELAIARLSLLQAQVEPHFLYNTLASAQVLVRSDPAGADAMLGHLIQYLRHSLPRTDRALASLGEELERSRAYLAILKIRMGARLNVQIDVPDELLATPLPPMLLQTLVENAIKHGLEPRPGDGTVWIFARRQDGRVAVTVADDGKGFGAQESGAGIGLKNARERLKLIYAGQASLAIAANFPHGVAATITVPEHYNEERAHG